MCGILGIVFVGIEGVNYRWKWNGNKGGYEWVNGIVLVWF